MQAHPPFYSDKARGNVLFLILIAVALFAALSYVVTKSTRGGGDISKEKAILDSGLAQQCTASVERAVNMLKLVGKCPDDQISYELADGTNENPSNPGNKDCFVFDKQGGDTAPCGPWLQAQCGAAEMLALTAGQKCTGADIVYVGVSGGRRIYTTTTDTGSTSWNDGIWGNAFADTGASSNSDGLANTNTLVAFSASSGVPHNAALMCRGLGAKWYLPAKDEGDLLYNESNTGILSGSFSPAYYWTSTQENGNGYYQAQQRGFQFGWQSGFTHRNTTLLIRCVRRD